MKIISQTAAQRMILDSLFQPVNGATLCKGKFDSGKYKGKPSSYFGKEVPDIKGIHAVYPVARRDSDGPYVQLLSVQEVIRP